MQKLTKFIVPGIVLTVSWFTHEQWSQLVYGNPFLSSTQKARHAPPHVAEPEWVQLGHQLGRVWSNTSNSNNDPYPWCIPQHNEYYGTRFLKRANQISWFGKERFVQGLIYVKSPKTGSSTGVGIALHMAHRVAARKFNATTGSVMCTVNYTHPFAFHKGHARRTRQRDSLLWTNVRHPAQQAISLFFHFLVSRKDIEPTAKNLIDCMESLKHAQASYLSPQRKLDPTINPIPTIMDLYDFIAVADRMEESLVVMKLLFGLQHGDLIVLPSKQAGAYEPIHGGTQQECQRVSIKSFPIQGTEDYIANEHVRDNWDYILFAAANRSLDLTIRALGQDRFEVELKRHRQLSRLVRDKCMYEAFPCTPEGVYHPIQDTCYAEDAGCGRACVDRVLAQQHEKRHLT